MTLGEYLSGCRIEKGLTQREVSEAIKTGSQYVSNVERNINKPAPKYLAKWASLVKANKNTVFKLMMSDYRNKVREGLEL